MSNEAVVSEQTLAAKPSTPKAKWARGHEPRSGRVARTSLRSTLDILAVEQELPDDVLPGNTIYDCLKASASAAPNKAAFKQLLSSDPAIAPRVISYAELLDQVERAANLFRVIAGGERSAVSIILPMVPEALIAAWGAATAGIANPINPYLELRHVASIMNASRATVLVTTTNVHGPGAWDKLDQLIGAVPTLRAVLLVDAPGADNDFAAALAQQSSGLSFTPNADPNADCVYLPTGGTTAAPKLVRMTHRGQLLNAWIAGAFAGSSEDGVVGHAMPNFHVGGSVMLALRAILYGQTVLTLTKDGFRDPGVVANFWDIARTHRMTSLIATPATAAAILAQRSGHSEGHCIRSFNCGGSTIPIELLRNFHQRFGVWLREVWGMSDLHGAVSGHPDSGDQPVAGSVGLHLPWHRVAAIQVDDHNALLGVCAPGERGVLAVSGPGLVPGYVDSSLDRELFVANAPGGQRWANTGDLGSVDADDYIWLFGRAKDVIIRGGHNIDPKMIEEVLSGHPAIQVVAAIGRPDASKGEMPIAYVQFKEGASASADELLQLCKERVQERAAVPVQILIVPQIPMTAVGKINKPALRVDSMRRVATEVTARVLGADARFEIVVDETGSRPRVIIRAQRSASQVSAMDAALRSAFANYEFQTAIELGAV